MFAVAVLTACFCVVQALFQRFLHSQVQSCARQEQDHFPRREGKSFLTQHNEIHFAPFYCPSLSLSQNNQQKLEVFVTASELCASFHPGPAGCVRRPFFLFNAQTSSRGVCHCHHKSFHFSFIYVVQITTTAASLYCKVKGFETPASDLCYGQPVGSRVQACAPEQTGFYSLIPTSTNNQDYS